mgnify:CR=1
MIQGRSVASAAAAEQKNDPQAVVVSASAEAKAAVSAAAGQKQQNPDHAAASVSGIEKSAVSAASAVAAGIASASAICSS